MRLRLHAALIPAALVNSFLAGFTLAHGNRGAALAIGMLAVLVVACGSVRG